MGPLSLAPIANCTIALSNRHTGETSSLTACSLVTSILEKLAQRSYDATLCHIRMPGLNGPAFYRAIEQRAPAFLSRVLVVLGDILSPETQAFLQQTAAPI